MSFDDEHRSPDPRMIPAHRLRARFERSTGTPPPLNANELAVDGLVVRPFILTGGRTRPLVDDLRIETLVLATPAALTAPLKFEERTVVRLCQRPHSLAEIAAALAVPLGVARVIIADLVAGDLVSVTAPAALPTSAIERIRDLVRAL